MKHNLQSDLVRLQHIMTAIKHVQNFTKGVSEKKFLKDVLLQSAVIRQFEIIGEAAGKLSKEIREKFNNVEWAAIIGFRNMLIHEYFNINATYVWNAIQGDMKNLKAKISKIIKEIKTDSV